MEFRNVQNSSSSTDTHIKLFQILVGRPLTIIIIIANVIQLSLQEVDFSACKAHCLLHMLMFYVFFPVTLHYLSFILELIVAIIHFLELVLCH